MEKKIKIYTRYNPCPRKVHIRSERDEVDRASYIDSTLQIRRFIDEGRSLATYRAEALRHGTYVDANDALTSNGNEPVVPVYDTDPAILKPIIDASIDTFETSQKEKTSVSDGKPSEDVTKDNSVNNGSEVAGPAVD